MMKCIGKDRHGDDCRNHSLQGKRVCKYHVHMENYTDDMLQQLTKCSGCLKMFCFTTDPNPTRKICDTCTERKSRNREMKKLSVTKCSFTDCDFKKSKENNYCGKHQKQLLVDSALERSKKMCCNYIRGCMEELELSESFSRCEPCRTAEREKDNKRRKVVQDKYMTGANSFLPLSLISTSSAPEIETAATSEIAQSSTCTTCLQTYCISEFRGRTEFTKDTVLKTCSKCRDQNKVQDAKRSREHVNELARTNSKKPERIEVKKAWVEENREKVSLYWMNSRGRQIGAGVEEYLERNAENARKWRERNPEKMRIVNEEKKNCITKSFKTYQRSAFTKNLDFELSEEEFYATVMMPCYYCDKSRDDRDFNGIDRLDSSRGYIEGNFVSCCSTCNFTKGSLSEEVFIKRVEHILTYRNLIEGKLFPETFAAHPTPSFLYYKTRAKNKKFDFELSEEKFHEITSGPCYLCGKEESLEHKNGLDRVNNSIGYVLENVQSCCGECNFMKRQLSLEKFLEKLNDIFSNTEHSILKDSSPTSTLEIKHIVETAKKSKEEIQEDARLRKQKQRDALKARYGDEEYKKMRAQENLQRREAERKIHKEEKDSDKVLSKSKDDIREAARLRKQKQREILVQNLGEDEYRKMRAKEYIERKLLGTTSEESEEKSEKYDQKTQKVPKTEEEIREDARLRKQKQRQNLRLELGEEEYKKMRRLESEKKKKSNESI